ncbi:MAG: carbohydate-binding domain-containing protein, partial [Cyclobacteriaceae bacterium]|nr:carbohydate-binding domain-containing protein [Cyclobacteriaceae bacterium]
MKRIIAIALLPLLIFSCEGEKAKVETKSTGFEILYKVESMDVENNSHTASITITNNTEKELSGNWTLYFNTLQGANFEVTNPEGLKAEWVVGNFKKIVPTDKFTPLAAGESRTYTYTGGGI